MELGRIDVPSEEAVAAGDERAALRFTLLIRSAKLIAPAGEFVCVIRDVSEIGVSLRGFHALPAEGPLWLELQTGERYAIEPVWNRGLETGYQFIERVEVAALVAEVGQFPKRQLRLVMSIPAELAFIGGRVRADIVNLSQQGARIECDALLAIDQPLRLCSGILPEVRARVRWRSERQYGLVFDDTFSLSELALFAAGAQSPELLAQPVSGVSQRR